MSMTKEQAIEIAKDFIKMDFSNPMGWTGYYDTELKELSQAIEIVLSILKDQTDRINYLENNRKQVKEQVEAAQLELGFAIDMLTDV